MQWLLTLLILATANNVDATKPFVLIPGHDSLLVSGLPEDGWLALYERGVATELRPARITTERDTSDHRAIHVQSVPSGAALLFRSIPGLSSGRAAVASLPADGIDLRGPGAEVVIELDGRKYTLVLQATSEQLANARLILRDGTREQIVYALDGPGDEPHFELTWAGDLDRDGLLDLVMTMSGKYSYHPRSVLLSSAAEEGEIVHEVAVWEHFSC